MFVARIERESTLFERSRRCRWKVDAKRGGSCCRVCGSQQTDDKREGDTMLVLERAMHASQTFSVCCGADHEEFKNQPHDIRKSLVKNRLIDRSSLSFQRAIKQKAVPFPAQGAKFHSVNVSKMW